MSDGLTSSTRPRHEPANNKVAINRSMSNTVLEDLERTKKELGRTQAELMNYRAENERLKTMLDDIQSQLSKAQAASEEIKPALDNLKLVEGRQSRKLQIIRACLDEKLTEPLTSVVDALEKFQDEVSSFAFFIGGAVMYKVPEIFQVELERSHQETQTLMGNKLYGILTTDATMSKAALALAEGKNVGPDTPNPPLVQIVAQIFIINFSFGYLKPSGRPMHRESARH